MRRESHVRFREGVGVQFPRATRPFIPCIPVSTLFLCFQISRGEGLRLSAD